MRKGSAKHEDIMTLLRLGFYHAVVQNHDNSLTSKGSVMSLHCMKMDAEDQAARLTEMYCSSFGMEGGLYQAMAVSELLENKS